MLFIVSIGSPKPVSHLARNPITPAVSQTSNSPPPPPSPPRRCIPHKKDFSATNSQINDPVSHLASSSTNPNTCQATNKSMPPPPSSCIPHKKLVTASRSSASELVSQLVSQGTSSQMNSRVSSQTVSSVSSQAGNIVSSQVRREVSQDRARTSNIKGGSCNKKWTELIRSESGTMTMISVTDLGQRTSTRKTKKIIKNKPQENSEAVKANTPKEAKMSAIS